MPLRFPNRDGHDVGRQRPSPRPAGGDRVGTPSIRRRRVQGLVNASAGLSTRGQDPRCRRLVRVARRFPPLSRRSHRRLPRDRRQLRQHGPAAKARLACPAGNALARPGRRIAGQRCIRRHRSPRHIPLIVSEGVTRTACRQRVLLSRAHRLAADCHIPVSRASSGTSRPRA